MNAIELTDVTKVYRRYARAAVRHAQERAALQRSILRDLQTERDFTALNGVSFTVPAGCTFGVVGRNGSGKSTMLKLRCGHHEADQRHRDR